MKEDIHKTAEEFRAASESRIVPAIVDRYNIPHRHFLSFTKELSHINCNEDVESSCVFECYDHILEENITVEMRNIKWFLSNSEQEGVKGRIDELKESRDVAFKYIEELDTETLHSVCKRVLHNAVSVDQPDSKIKHHLKDCISQTMRIGSGDTVAWYWRNYFDIDIGDASCESVITDTWHAEIKKAKNNAEAYLFKERRSCETDLEREAVTEVLQLVKEYDIDKDIHDHAEELLFYWPNIFLPAPAFVGEGPRLGMKWLWREIRSSTIK